ncbi:family 78 glycoside hydrolase catalytic domain [Clostridium facile]|uniref:alpha-L-rhamnosidase n=1 Tax=Clostridium facile TaxID=2763035 RepID=A0ABR7IQS3_9CLOT|nr:family 78 glycoside hydrolase catalytic domain [Clostridium facile]MBC5787472.1 family 78 glycoside hydrolase catalytic domain [Clostridium facile]
MKRNKILALVLAIAMVFTMIMPINSFAASEQETQIVGMKTNDLENPMGIDTPNPIFSWKMSSTIRGQKQTAYQVVVAKDDNFQNVVWDSQKQTGDVSIGITYAGDPLEAYTTYYWKVTIWDKDGKQVVSDAATFEMGVLSGGFDDADWIVRGGTYPYPKDLVTLDGANWIWAGSTKAQPETAYFRFKFQPDANKTLENAYVAFTADDYGVAHFNGTQIADIPNEGDIWRTGRVIYLTDMINPNGENIFTASIVNKQVGDGGLVAKIVLTYTDGTHDIFVTDETWLASNSTNITEDYTSISYDDSDRNIWKYPNRANENEVVPYGSAPWYSNVGLPNEASTYSGKVAAPIFRKQFDLDQTAENVVNARIYATAAGLYELTFNDKKAGDEALAPGFTQYEDHITYQAYNVTDLIKDGQNTISATIGKGWYLGAIAYEIKGVQEAFIAKMVITYADGSTQTIVTDDSWEYTDDGPILSNDMYNGEVYDATRTLKPYHYSKVGTTTAEALGIGQIISQISGSVKPMEILEPVAVTEPKEGLHIFDFGQNFAGVVELTVNTEAGTQIMMRHAEALNNGEPNADGDPGTLYLGTLRNAKPNDYYTAKGGGPETYRPSFTYHGFRYVEISGIDLEDIVSVKGIVLYSDMEDTGSFESSNSLVNRLERNVYWGQRSNFLSIPTDCPQRDERYGYTGDSQVFSDTSGYNMDVKAFFDQYLMSVNDCVFDNGAFPNSAPGAPPNDRNDPAYNGWADGGVIIPYNMYIRYGDVGIIERSYDKMVNYIEYLYADRDENHLRTSQTQYGDWLALDKEETPVALTDTAFCAYVCDLMTEMATAIGKTEDAERFAGYAQGFKDAWAKFYLKENGQTIVNTQTSYVIGLAFDVVPDDMKQATADQLAAVIQSDKYNGKISTGFISTGFLLPVLCEYGHEDIAYSLLEDTEFPSFLYPVTQGATTIWERWDSYSPSGFGNPTMNSFNHFAFGTVARWLYSGVLGITVDPASPAYKHFSLQPVYGGSMTYANGSYNSQYGLIESGWKLDGNDFTYNAIVPANTTATLYLPSDKATAIYESGKDVTKEAVEGIEYIGTENGKAIFELQSGSYSFSSTVVNKAELEEAISNASNINEFFYTADSYRALTEALAKAQEVQNNKDATAEQVQQATDLLNSAIENLVPIAQDGSESNPYQINSLDQFKLFANTVNSGDSFQDKYVELNTDIDLSGINWTPIGTSNSTTSGAGFAGTFNGNGHVVSNITIPGTSKYATFGLFGTVTGTVKNLGVENVTITHDGVADLRAGGLAGTLSGGLIDNSYVINANVSVGGRVAAGFLGLNRNGTIQNSYAKDITVTGGRTGGFVSDNQDDSGNNKGTIINCYANTSITASSHTGNIENSRTIENEQFIDGSLVDLLNQGNPETVWEQGETHPVLVVTETPEPPVDTNKTILDKVIVEANHLKGTDEYNNAIPSVQQSFDKALEEAQNVYNNPSATQEEVNTAWQTLLKEIHKLGFQKGDKTALQELYDQVKDTDLSQYRDGAAKENFKTALANAETVLADEEAMQKEIDKAYNDLKAAYEALEKLADKSQLKALLDECAGYQEEDYTPATWEVFAGIQEKAQEVYENANASQEEVNAAIDELLSGMLQLRFKADKSILETVIKVAGEIDGSSYTAESYGILQAAVAKANEVMADENASQEEVDAATTRVQEAMKGLVTVETPAENNHVDGTQTGQESTTPKANAAKTGDFAPIAGLAVITLAGAALLLTRKKK